MTSGVDRAAGCDMLVPYGATIIASIDPLIIPAGYVLEGGSTLEFSIPDGPPEGFFGGPIFVLLPADEAVVDEEYVPADMFTLTSFAAFCDPGYIGVFDGCTPWDGLTISFISADGTYVNSCVTSSEERAASCVIDVPFGTTITAWIDSSSIPAGYMLEGNLEQGFTIPDRSPDGIYSGPSFVLLPVETAPTEVSAQNVPLVAPETETAAPTATAAVISLPKTGVGVIYAESGVSRAKISGLLLGASELSITGMLTVHGVRRQRVE